MKRLYLIIIGFLLIPILSFSAEPYKDPSGNTVFQPRVDANGNQTVSSIDATKGRRSVLQPYTSAAIDVVMTPYNASTTSGTYRAYKSSAMVVLSSASALSTVSTGLIGQATYHFDLNRSTSDTINEYIQQLNLNAYITATLVDGCYGAGVTTTTVTGRSDDEGNTTGFQYDGTGKLMGGTTNQLEFTLYLNATDTMSRYYAEDNNQYFISRIASTGTYTSNTINVYQGADVLNTTTKTTMTINDWFEDYAGSNIVIDDGNAAEVRIVGSTWIVAGAEFEVWSSTR